MKSNKIQRSEIIQIVMNLSRKGNKQYLPILIAYQGTLNRKKNSIKSLVLSEFGASKQLFLDDLDHHSLLL